MIYLALLALTVATWALVHLAAAGQRALLAKRTGRPAGGVSLLPGMIVMPALLTGAAWLIDVWLDRWHPRVGTICVAAAHAVLLVVASVSVIRSSREVS
jgi:hypothetical protein